MEIGEGGTNVWYLGGIAQNNAECIILSHSELASSENREKVILTLNFRVVFSRQLQHTNTVTTFKEQEFLQLTWIT